MIKNNYPRDDANIEVSFLVPVYNGIEYTKEFIASFNNTIKNSKRSYEILIGDNGSTDGSRDFLKTLVSDKLKVFLNEKNLYYGGNMNNLAKHARGKFLVLMNNDLVLTPNWLEPMVEIFEKRKDIGIVGNIQMIPTTGTMDHMGVAFIPAGLPFHVSANQFPREKYTEWNAVTGACVVIQKETFLKIEGYDEKFKNGYEDIDLCLRVKQTGLRVYTANKSIIYHYTSRSTDRASYLSDNHILFLQRWRETGNRFFYEEVPIHEKLRAEEYLRQARLKSKWWRVSIRKLFKAFLLKYFRPKHKVLLKLCQLIIK